ncbi:MAG: Hpt domain-containing protein [Phormidesmis sp.]
MMIEDEELRSLYQNTCKSRLSVLKSGLLGSDASGLLGTGAGTASAASENALETLRREAHSLKGDSRVMGLEEIADVAQAVEQTIKFLQQPSSGHSLSSDALHALMKEALLTIERQVRLATVDSSPQENASADERNTRQVIERIEATLSEASANRESGTEGQSDAEGQSETEDKSDAEDKYIAGVATEGIASRGEREPDELSEDIASTASTLIADNDIRRLYRTTSEQRLQVITQALEQLIQDAQNVSVLNTAALAAFRYESQGLKGDSLEVAQGAIAAITGQFESIANRLIADSLELTQPLQDSLWKGVQSISRLIHHAVSADADTDINRAIAPESLSALLDELATYLKKDASDLADDLWSPVELIEDEELREIYRTTSEQRLNRLESHLSQLATSAVDPELVVEMLREAHSLKGDARSTQVTPVAEMAEALEGVLSRIQAQSVPEESDHSESAGQLEQASPEQSILTRESLDSIRESILAMGALVQTATVGVPNHVNVALLIQNLQVVQTLEEANSSSAPATSERSPIESLAAAPVLPDEELSTESAESDHLEAAHSVAPDAQLDVSQAPNSNAEAGIEANLEAGAASGSSIEDEELREVYRAVSAERLQRLERGLAQLLGQPDDSAVMAELLREAHSLKGDARSVDLGDVEQLAHAIEDILIGIQRQPTILTAELSDLLLRGIDAIAQLMDEATTGHASSPVETKTLVSELRAVELPASESTEEPTEPDDLSALAASTQSALLQPSVTQPLPAASLQTVAGIERIETIRVQTRDLDALAAQTEQLTLTRIQTAQTTAKMMELVDLWSKWRTHQRRHPAAQNQTSNPYEAPIDALINRLRLSTQENSFRLDLISQDLGQQVQTLRLLPVSTVLRNFPRVVRDLARKQSKSVELITEGEETTADKRILEDIQDSLTQLIRNAIDHGIEPPAEREAVGKSPTATLSIRSYQSPNSIVIEVADDGRGLDVEQIKQTAIRRKLYSSEELDSFSPSQIQELIFVPGFSTRSFTTEISGRGVGLDVVRTQVERLKGNVQVDSMPGRGCTFRLQIRTQLATANVVFVSVRGVVHALPIEFLQTTMRLSPDDIVTADGKDTIQWNGQTVLVRDLFDVLELANSPAYQPPAQTVADGQRACLLLRAGDELGAFLVDRLLDTQEVVFKPQSAILKRVRNVVGLTILGNGDICTILNPADLIKSIQRTDERAPLPLREAPSPRKPLILLVEDSPPVRIQEKRLFENAGYEVVTAEDGLEGYEILREGRFDAVISDIEMPNLDGLSLTRKIREHQEYEELPIILVTTLSTDQDRQRGADMGANAYIVKGKFNQEALLETLHRLI